MQNVLHKQKFHRLQVAPCLLLKRISQIISYLQQRLIKLDRFQTIIPKVGALTPLHVGALTPFLQIKNNHDNNIRNALVI